MATTRVTAAPMELKEVLAASGSRTFVDLVNESGTDVKLYVDGAAEHFREVSGIYPSNQISLGAGPAALSIHARCDNAPLALRVLT